MVRDLQLEVYMCGDSYTAKFTRRERQALLDAQRALQAAGIPTNIEQTRLVAFFPTDVAVFSLVEVKDPMR